MCKGSLVDLADIGFQHPVGQLVAQNWAESGTNGFICSPSVTMGIPFEHCLCLICMLRIQVFKNTDVMQQDADILLLQTFSTCSGHHAPIIRSIKYCHGSHRYRQLWLQVDPHFSILGTKLRTTCTGGCRVSILYS